jgi:hypothetical protein
MLYSWFDSGWRDVGTPGHRLLPLPWIRVSGPSRFSTSVRANDDMRAFSLLAMGISPFQVRAGIALANSLGPSYDVHGAKVAPESQ